MSVTSDLLGVGYSNERLFTITPRSALSPATGGDRGYRGYIQLASSNPVNVYDTSIYSPSIAGSGGTLDQAVNGGQYGGYANFLITGLQCQLSEKIQITETFGDGEVYYYFGRQPIGITVSGILIDSVENDWFTQWMFMYGQVLRGTQTASRYQLIRLYLPTMVLVGTIASMSFNQTSERDCDIPFQFQFMAKEIIPIPVMNTNMVLASAASYLNIGQASTFLDQVGLNSLKSSLAQFSSMVTSSTSGVSNIAQGITGFSNTITANLNSVSSAFYSVTATLAGLRASLFSPIYGVLSSLTKLVGAISGVVNAFESTVTEVNNIVRDLQNISSIAIGLVTLANAALFDGGGALLGGNNISTPSASPATLQAIGNLSNSAGVISTAPPTLFQYLQSYVAAGQIPVSSEFMQNQSIASLTVSETSLSKLGILNSGTPYSAAQGAFL
jgi:hypothetical protein